MYLEDCKDESGLNPCLILAGSVRSNLKVINSKAPGLLKELLEFIDDIYALETKWSQRDPNSLFQFAYIHVVEPNVNYLYYLVLQCALPQVLYTMRLVIETLMSSAYADIIAAMGMEPNPTLGVKLGNYASTFNMKNLVDWPRDLRDYYAQVVRRFEEPLGWFINEVGLGNGGVINFVYLVYDRLSKLIHPVTMINGKYTISGVVVDAILDYVKGALPSSRHLYAPFECEETDDALFSELDVSIRRVRLVLYLITYAWAVNTRLMGEEGLELIRRRVKDEITKLRRAGYL